MDKILTTDTGIDLVTNRKIFLSREVYQAENYIGALHHVIKSAREEGVGASAVDSCLRIVAVNVDELGRKAAMTGIVHLFYHWNNPAATSALPDMKGFIAEVDPAAARPFVDLVAHSMIVRWSYPVFIWGLDPEELFDLVMSRVLVFAQFDIHDFTVLAQLHSPRFVDAAPRAIYATLLDEGQYLCSPRTMYRLLAAAHEVKERRNQLRHVAPRPELLATAPNEVWSWDITKLLGPATWTYYYLYVILDIFSRYVVGWMVAHVERARRRRGNREYVEWRGALGTAAALRDIMRSAPPAR